MTANKDATCYLCEVKDPNAESYHPESHKICVMCAVRLWELAQVDYAFNLRGQVITVAADTVHDMHRIHRPVGNEYLDKVSPFAFWIDKASLVQDFPSTEVIKSYTFDEAHAHCESHGGSADKMEIYD